MKRISKSIWIGILIANIAIILFYWWQSSSNLFTQEMIGLAIAFGRLFGLAAAVTVLLQFVFIGRTPWLERSFGLDKLSNIHRLNGKLSLLFLLLHPLLLIYGYSRASDISVLSQFRSFIFDYEYINWALIGLLLFISIILTSLVIIRQKLRYESWYYVHLLVYLAVFFSFWHQINNGATLLTNQFFYSYWITLYSFVLIAHFTFRFGRPLYLWNKHRFTVSRVVRENNNTVSVYIKGKNIQEFHIHPGQFMILRFLTKDRWWQAHPFSLSQFPNERELRITVKELGDFTKEVGKLTVGTHVIIDGPYGIFTERVSSSSKILFIAGGIGITPIRSLMEEMLKKGKDVVLLYGNRTVRDIIFKDELEDLANKYNAKITYVLSEEVSYEGESGIIDQEKLERLVPDIYDREVYLCGPQPMLESLIKILRNLEIPPSRIYYEKFVL